MKLSEITAILEKLNPRFLQGLTPPELKEVLALARVRQYPANAIVSHEGHPADNLFLLLSGRARFFTLTPNGDKTLLFWAAPGDCLGVSAVLSRPYDYLLSAEIVKAADLLCWDGPTMAGLCQRYPRLMENSLLIAYDYMVLYRSLHLALTCKNARQRLATVLVNLASGIGQKVSEGVQLDINNEELASEAHVTHFTASRLMSQWQRDGVLVKKRGKVVLPSPERLLTRRS
jgi:CRP-like cAMP-binding protein